MAQSMNYHAQATSEQNAQLVTNIAQSATTPRATQQTYINNNENLYVNPPPILSSIASLRPSSDASSSSTVVPSPQPSFSPSVNRPRFPSQIIQPQPHPPRLNSSGATASTNTEHRLRVEKNRLDTFAVGWPVDCPVRPSQLAATGFYYIEVGDIVRCAFCQGTLKQWAPGDVASDEHAKYFPSCPFVCGINVGNVPLPRRLDLSNIPPTQHTQQLTSPLHVFPLEWRQHYFPAQNGPLVPEFANIDHRQQSFFGKPVPDGQTVTALTEAGFYYIGPEDNVKCYYCGGSLKSWTSTDKPLSEHFRWFPHCPLMQQQSQLQRFQQISLGEGTRNAATAGTGQTANRSATGSPQRGNAVIQQAVLPMSVEQHLLTLGSESGYTVASHSVVETSELPSSGTTTTAGGAVAGSNNPVAGVGRMEKLLEENRRLKDSILCKICMDATINTLFLPCGHLVCCDNCAPSLQKCPICRVDIRGSIRTYIA